MILLSMIYRNQAKYQNMILLLMIYRNQAKYQKQKTSN